RVLSLVQPESFEAAARAILAARSVAAFGVGASGLVAYDLTQKLFRLGVPCSFAFDPHLQATAACGLRPDDVAIAVSYSGRTESVVRAAEEARRSGAKVLAVTILGGTPLAKLADVVLPIPATEAVFRQGASMSRITQLVVVDILYATLVSRDIERAIPLIERSMRATHNSAEKGRYNAF
ncbi:MAG: SIS domain-containing protein, partial [Spirochaetaceae bacterium]|nr:SIS domain-containing protein [Spirochaetaceae bacterium]